MMGYLDMSGFVFEGKVVFWWGMVEDGFVVYIVELKVDGMFMLYEEGNEKWGNYVWCLKE